MSKRLFLAFLLLVALQMGSLSVGYGEGAAIKHAFLPECVQSICAGGEDYAVMQIGEGRLLCFDTAKKRIRWSLGLEFKKEGNLVLARSDVLLYADSLAVVYFPNTDLRVKILKVQSGEIVGDFALEGKYNRAVALGRMGGKRLLYCDSKVFVLCYGGYVYVYDMAARKLVFIQPGVQMKTDVWGGSLVTVEGSTIKRVFDVASLTKSEKVIYTAEPGRTLCFEALEKCLIVYERQGVIDLNVTYDIQIIDRDGNKGAKTASEKLIWPSSMRGEQAVHFISRSETPLALDLEKLEFLRWKAYLGELMQCSGGYLLSFFGHTDSYVVIKETDGSIADEVPMRSIKSDFSTGCPKFLSVGYCVFSKDLGWVEDVAKALAKEKEMVLGDDPACASVLWGILPPWRSLVPRSR
ncbi:MAG: hypothetical protein WC712_08035 [Candidatus Brocadiia bacterium]